MTEQELDAFELEMRDVKPSSMSTILLDELEAASFLGQLQGFNASDLKSTTLQRFEEKIFEAEVSECVPTELKPELLDLLELAPAEAELSEFSATPLNHDLLNRLSGLVEQTDTQESNPNIIQFPHHTSPDETKTRKTPLNWIGAVAAVALFGLFCGTALLNDPSLNNPSPSNTIISAKTELDQKAMVRLTPAVAPNVVTVSSDRTFLGARDQGILPTSNKLNRYRAYQVQSMETYYINDNDGKTIEIRKPKNEIILIPATTD